MLWAWTVLFVLGASTGSAQLPAAQVVDDGADLRVQFRVEVIGYISADFQTRVAQYADLRRTLEEGVPPLQVTTDPADIWRAEVALARKIRQVRESKQGQLFTPAIT